MSKFFTRYRRRVIVKALRQPQPIFVLAAADVVPQLVEGRL
jgi:hypothetical protein